MTKIKEPNYPPNRNTELGDRASFCTQCGWARRYFPGVVEPPESCDSCGGDVVSNCSNCGADILSIMAVECDMCNEPLRKSQANGIQIRRGKRLPRA